MRGKHAESRRASREERGRVEEACDLARLGQVSALLDWRKTIPPSISHGCGVLVRREVRCIYLDTAESIFRQREEIRAFRY
jgi:hypothetical protein